MVGLTNNQIQREMSDYSEIPDDKLIDLGLDPKTVSKFYDVIDVSKGLYLVSKKIQRKAWIPHEKMIELLIEGEGLGLFELKPNEKGFTVVDPASQKEYYGSSPSEADIMNFVYAGHKDRPYGSSDFEGRIPDIEPDGEKPLKFPD